MKNTKFDAGWHQLEIHSYTAYSKELAQSLENALEDVGIEITHFTGEERHFGRSVHNSPNIASVYTFRLKEDVAAVDVHQACVWAGLEPEDTDTIDYKYISLGNGEELIWSSDASWWDTLWKNALRDLGADK